MADTLGKRIVNHRKRLGLTQDQLAEQLGVTAQAVSKWENDQSCPDITTLPRLASIFGITTDALLGIEKEPPAHQATVVQEEDVDENQGFHYKNGNWEFSFDHSRSGGITFAVLVILVGVLYLVRSLLHLDISLWDIIWPSSLLVFGFQIFFRKFFFLRLGCILFGGISLINLFLPTQIQLDNGVVVAIVILLIGGGLMMDALKKPKKPFVHFSRSPQKHEQPHQDDFHVGAADFRFEGSFGEAHRTVELDLLKEGHIETNFGDVTVDLSGVSAVSPDCHIEASTNFGNLTLQIPGRFLVKCVSSTSFGSIEEQGQPDKEPVGVIHLNATTSFGNITVEYI